MKRFVAIFILFLLPVCARAQAADTETRELIARLLARIDTLEQRVTELEKGRDPKTPAVPAARQAPAEATAAHLHEQAPGPETPTSEAAQPVYPSLKLSGFGDVNFSATNLHGTSGGFGPQTLLAPHSGFALGQTTLHLTSALSPKVSFFGELTFTARTDAGTGSPSAPGFNPEVERLILRYDANDYFKISFGRYHTPVNYWNTAFHHGQWLQTTISRPEMTQFGGAFIPVHFIGTLVEGAVPAGGLNLNYNFGLGNGRGQVIGRGGDAGDINNNRAWLVNLFVKPNLPYGIQVGGSVYRDRLNPIGGQAAGEWIESAHIVWQKETPEFLAEFANVTHQPVFGRSRNSQAWYVQAAYRLPWFERLWKPYYRIEQIHVPRSDATFRAVPTFTGSTAGVRYDFSSLAAFKLEYRYYWLRDSAPVKGIFAQTSFTF
ncbi:MAG: hypothetical protein C5B51_31070 [Terriglobia bacterium]|nr:MAG: hypothetical protein C5B51_31070 [Terriglobia bacterium]